MRHLLRALKHANGSVLIIIIIWRAKLIKTDWLMRRAFFLNSRAKLLGPDWLIFQNVFEFISRRTFNGFLAVFVACEIDKLS